jgi:lysozyme
LQTAGLPSVANSPEQTAAELCKVFEGCYLTPYLCPAGICTIGFGATFYENGVRVTLSDPPITKERAEQLLNWMIISSFGPKVRKLCLSATGNQLAALIDFAFNLGTGALAGSTLRRCVNAGDWEGARTQILRWNKARGKVLAGLTRRRAAEAALL